MECRDVREMADSFLGEELLTETDTNMRYHLMLRALDDRFGQLRTAMRAGGI